MPSDTIITPNTTLIDSKIAAVVDDTTPQLGGDLDLNNNFISFIKNNVPFDADDFTASGSMTWTVEAGDVLSFYYVMLTSTLMYISVSIKTTTVGGTPSNQLLIKIPNNKRANGQQSWIGLAVDNNTLIYGRFGPVDEGTNIRCFREDVANWTASTDLTAVEFQTLLEVEDIP